MVLAAGYGTRLGTLSELRPKPMLPVCNIPLVQWVATLLASGGCGEISLNLHHLGASIRAALGERLSVPAGSAEVPLHYCDEPTILGTGGGIRNMADSASPAQTYAIANGKIVCDLDLERVLHFHRSKGALVTLVLFPVPNPEAWGPIGIDNEGRLCRLLDQRRPTGAPSRDFLFTGVHLVEREVIEAMSSLPSCVIRETYRELFRADAPLYGYVHPGYFFEHSTPERYLQGNFNLLARGTAISAAPFPLTGVAPGAVLGHGVQRAPQSLIGAGALVGEGATIGELTVVGAGATIAPGVRIERSVVWPGAEVTVDLERAIATGSETLSVGPLDDPWAKPR